MSSNLHVLPLCHECIRKFQCNMSPNLRFDLIDYNKQEKHCGSRESNKCRENAIDDSSRSYRDPSILIGG